MEAEQTSEDWFLPLDSGNQSGDDEQDENPEQDTLYLLGGQALNQTTQRKDASVVTKSHSQQSAWADNLQLAEFLSCMQKPRKVKFYSERQIPMRRQTQKRITDIQISEVQIRSKAGLCTRQSPQRGQIGEIYCRHVLQVSPNTKKRTPICLPPYYCDKGQLTSTGNRVSSSIKILCLDDLIRQQCCVFAEDIRTTLEYHISFRNTSRISQPVLNTTTWMQSSHMAIECNGRVLIVDTTRSQVVNSFQLQDCFSNITSLASRDDLISVGENCGRITLYDVRANKTVQEVYLRSEVSRVECISWKNDNSFAAGFSIQEAATYDIRTKNRVMDLPIKGVYNLKWSPNQNYLATVGDEIGVYVWDERKINRPITVTQGYTTRGVDWINGSLLAMGSDCHSDKSITLWDVNQSAVKRSITTEQSVVALQFNPMTGHLISGHCGSQKNINCWSVPGLQRVSGHTLKSDGVVNLLLNKQKDKLATLSISFDTDISVWRLNSRSDGGKESCLDLQLR